MARKLPDLSTTQLIASAAATAVAAFGASYLGVYGTIIGAALMSVISTAGAAVGKHYLDQGREQLKDLANLQGASRRRQAARDAAREATSADPTRTAARTVTRTAARTATAPFGMAGDPNATRLDPPLAGDPNATRVDPAATVAGSLAEEAGPDAVREAARRSAWRGTVAWAKAHWVALAVSSAAVFAVVLGGITLIEATTGQPIGGGGRSGLTVTKVLGGDTDGRTGDAPPAREPSDGPGERPGPGGEPTGEAPGTGSGTPEPQPTDEGTQQPTRQPTEQPTQQPPTAPTTAPDLPEPPQGPQGGGSEGPPSGGQQVPAE